MKLQRENLEKWPTPIEIYWGHSTSVKYTPEKGYRLHYVYRITKYDPISLSLIASASQAYALQRAMLKRYDKFMEYHWSKRDNHVSSAMLLGYTRNFTAHLQHIQPGALYFYSQVVVGTRKISRPFPDPRNPTLTAEQIASTPGIEGSVVIDDRFAHYYVKATVSRLNVIPKDRYQRA
jgi:hypothetical protein